MITLLWLFAIALASAAQPRVGAAQPRVGAAEPPYSTQQLALVRELTDVAISPDGCRVAFAADISGSQEVWLAPACPKGLSGPGGGGGATSRTLRDEPGWPRQLSSLGEQAVELAFSPDGKSVLFASDRGGDERRDLYLAPASGGAVAALTRSNASETDPDADKGASFSPDGRWLAYVADRPSRSNATTEPRVGAAEPRVGAAEPRVGAADSAEGIGFQLHVMDLATGESRQVTRHGVSLRRPVWSPDGRSIAVSASADGQQGELLFVDVRSGATRSVAAPTPGGILIPEEFMPGGADLLCLARNEKGFLQLALVGARGGSPRLIGPGDWDVDGAAARLGAGIVFSRNEDGRSALYRMASPTSSPRRLFGPAGRIASFDVDAAGERLAMLWGDSRRPADVWVLDLKTGKRARVTDALAGGVEPDRLEEMASLKLESADGTPIQAFYLPPRAWTLGMPAPVVVAPHGGPDLQTFDEFNALWQALSQVGFAVVAPNYRGSSGYGKAFLDLNNKDWGGKDLDDLWAGVQYLADRGFGDTRRAGVIGDSYGGYLTLMALARRPGQWAAGVELYGMPDLTLDFDLSGKRFLEWYKTEMGTPATDGALFKERSAITYIDDIKAPLLIFQGANDTNVPPAESELIYRKLLERRVPVGLVVYPDEGHGFTKRRSRADFMRRTVDFFLAQLGERKTPPAAEPRVGAAEPRVGAAEPRVGAADEEQRP